MPEMLPHDVEVLEVKALLDGGEDFLLLDCRNQDEYDLVHLGGSRLIPMGEIQARVSEIEPFREKRVVVLCHLGGRSQMVCEWLRQVGFAKVQNMVGGIDAWAGIIDTTLPRY